MTLGFEKEDGAIVPVRITGGGCKQVAELPDGTKLTGCITATSHPCLHVWTYQGPARASGQHKLISENTEIVNNVIVTTRTEVDNPNYSVDTHAAQLIADVKKQAAALLQPTDWYAIRKADTGDAIPSDVNTYREAVRNATNAYEAAINEVDGNGDLIVTTHDQLVAIQVAWPVELGVVNEAAPE